MLAEAHDETEEERARKVVVGRMWIPWTGATIDKSSTHRENPSNSVWIHGAGYVGRHTQ